MNGIETSNRRVEMSAVLSDAAIDVNRKGVKRWIQLKVS